MPKQENQIILMNGEISLFQRSNGKKGIYYVRVKDKDGTAVIKSTKTGNIDLARDFAFNFLIEVKSKIKAGIIVKSPTIKSCYELWIKEFWRKDERFNEQSLDIRNVNKKNNRFKMVVYQFNKYILPFMGALNVSAIKTQTIIDYCIHRSNYYRDNPHKINSLTKLTPSITTIKMELTAIRHLLKYALVKGFITEIPTFDIPTTAVKLNPKRVRTGITKEEYDKVVWHEEQDFNSDESIKLLDKRHILQRKIVCRLMEFVSLTYLRAGEALRLKWTDISIFTGEDENKYFKISIRDGKTGARTVIAPHIIAFCLGQLKDITGKFDYIFCDPKTGKVLENPNKTINKLFNEVGIKRRIVLYDFRHFGITQALLLGNDIYDISLNAGTSVSHIQNTYSKVLVSQKANKLARFRRLGKMYEANKSQVLVDMTIKDLGDLIRQED